jgi:CO/xanthine dehydrogenase FAD-binding subunit
MPEIENYLSPRALDDAIKVMATDNVTIVCGGTDLTPQTDTGQRQYAATLMNIRRIAGLSGISQTDNKIRIAALTTVTEIMESELLKELAPVLVEAGDQFASDQIRNAASIGGNLCNASPAGDMSIPLLLLDASVELASWQDNAMKLRLVPLCEFFTAPGRTVKDDSELLTAVVFDQSHDSFVARFRKSGPRPALEISTVSVGIGGRFDNGRFSEVRVAMGAVAPTPLRTRKVEAALEGKMLNAETIEAALESASKEVKPIDDIRASAWYRDHLVKVFTKEVLTHVADS